VVTQKCATKVFIRNEQKHSFFYFIYDNEGGTKFAEIIDANRHTPALFVKKEEDNRKNYSDIPHAEPTIPLIKLKETNVKSLLSNGNQK
jgi:hypothetical protein